MSQERRGREKNCCEQGNLLQLHPRKIAVVEPNLRCIGLMLGIKEEVIGANKTGANESPIWLRLC